MIADRRIRTWFVVIVAGAFVLRLAWLIYAKVDAPSGWLQSGDQYSYWYYGNEIAAGRGYVSYVTHTPTAYYPIGFPAILAALFFVANHIGLGAHLVVLAGLLHVIVSTATVAFVFLIGRRVFTPFVGLVGAALLAVFPNAIYQVTDVVYVLANRSDGAKTFGGLPSGAWKDALTGESISGPSVSVPARSARVLAP